MSKIDQTEKLTSFVNNLKFILVKNIIAGVENVLDYEILSLVGVGKREENSAARGPSGHVMRFLKKDLGEMGALPKVEFGF